MSPTKIRGLGHAKNARPIFRRYVVILATKGLLIFDYFS
jgi:hypothetical protein